jgi:polar amino acid transport system permease protein
MSDSLRQVLDVSVFWEYRTVLLRGLAVNLYVFAGAALVALSVGLGAALLRVSRIRAMRWIGTLHVEVFRNAPDYEPWSGFISCRLFLSDRCSIPASSSTRSRRRSLRWDSSTRLLRRNLPRRIEGHPAGTPEAARSCGMPERMIPVAHVLPQVVRRMLPESINQFISLFTATTIVSLIAVPDLMYQVSMITQQEMRPLPLYTGAALTYFVVILVAGNVLRALWERWRTKVFE